MKGPTPNAASRMLDVAVARIAREGMSVALDNVRMEEVIAEAGVSRATAYRRWPTRDDFLTDVLVETVHRTALIPETPDDINRILAAVTLDPASLLDAQARRDLVVEALRISMDLDVRRIAASPAWRTYLSLTATYRSLTGRARTEVGKALAATARAFDERRAEIYANLSALLGYRLAGPLQGPEGFLALGQGAGALMTGIVSRALVDDAWLDERTELTLHGASRPAAWSMPERLGVAHVLGGLEPDPTVEWTVESVAARLGALGEQVTELMTRPSSPIPRGAGPQ